MNGYVVPERSYRFLQRSTQGSLVKKASATLPSIEACINGRNPVNVMLLVGCSRYDMGTFEVLRYEVPLP